MRIRRQRRAADAIETIPAGVRFDPQLGEIDAAGAAAGARSVASASTSVATIRTVGRVGQAAERRRSCRPAAKVSSSPPPRTLPGSTATVFRDRRAGAGQLMQPECARAVPGTGTGGLATARYRVFPRHVQPDQRQQRRRRQVVAHVVAGPSWWPARWRCTGRSTRRRSRRSCTSASCRCSGQRVGKSSASTVPIGP